ncbi:MAG: Gfo/Idh/MocA family oxidoreductase [Clostridia bacterium]|nr:Gfo/Idh/MocA family oxidoreductase [Clostridia bacterium]
MKNDRIKLGIVGLGRAGNGMHVKALLEEKSDLYEIVAVCDPIAERCEKVKEKTGCRTYATIEELLRDDEVELVDIATRSNDHYRHAVLALEAGKHVFCEKPITLNVDEVKDLFARAEKPGSGRFFPQQNRRFEGVFQNLAAVIASGKLGNVFEISLSQRSYQRRDDWQTISEFGGGQLFNWGPHIVDHALRLLGAPVAQQYSHCVQAAAGGDCEDHFTAHLIGENGRKVNVCISGASALYDGRRYMAFGSRGSFESCGMKVKLKYIDPEQVLPPVVSDPGTPGDSFGASGTFGAAVDVKWVTEEYDVKDDILCFWDAMYASLREGKEYPIKSAEVVSLIETLCRIKNETPICHFNG